MIPDPSNQVFYMARDLVNQSSRSLFITGKAGTGKTTFLKYIRENCHKQMAVVAPTGVAAINAGGVTIHSFFQLPISPFIPAHRNIQGFGEINDRHSLLKRLRFNNERRKVLQQLDLLIIDEISMVRCDTLDAIDTVLRHIRHKPTEAFGGVQVILIGDMFQLQPVVPADEWNLLSEFYEGPFFFNSQVLKNQPPLYIEFKKIYRQTDEEFINLLNNVRNNIMQQEDYELLQSRFNPEFQPTNGEGYIVLTTHNSKADAINNKRLQMIDERTQSFRADIKDEFPEKSFPAEEVLNLKVGAQVMFIRNDTEKIRRYFNGKIGIISRIDDDEIYVQCQDDDSEIKVTRETWENIRYTLERNTRKLEEKVLGTFTQFPLRLAWAITIHKSQGLTFDKAIIDAGEAFAPGQVYVALSRCTNLEGMVLKTRIRPGSLGIDSRISKSLQDKISEAELKNELDSSKQKYFQEIIYSLFDFRFINEKVIELGKYVRANQSSFNAELLPWIEQLTAMISDQSVVSKKFHAQLVRLFENQVLYEADEKIQERTKAAALYFIQELGKIKTFITGTPAVTDSRIHAKEYNESIKELFQQACYMIHMLEGFKNEFSVETWHKRKTSFNASPVYLNAYSAEQKDERPLPELMKKLKQLRDRICNEKDLPVYFVANAKTLEEMVEYLPQNDTDLKQITGFGDAKIRLYGEEFLSIIREYSDAHELESRISEKEEKTLRKRKKGLNNLRPAKESKETTKAISYRMFNEGKSLDEIARTRGFNIQTIEGHLSHYIRMGELPIEKLMDSEKLAILEPHIKEFTGDSIIQLKEKLGDKFSFGEIRMALAWKDYRKSQVV